MNNVLNANCAVTAVSGKGWGNGGTNDAGLKNRPTTQIAPPGNILPGISYE